MPLVLETMGTEDGAHRVEKPSMATPQTCPGRSDFRDEPDPAALLAPFEPNGSDDAEKPDPEGGSCQDEHHRGEQADESLESHHFGHLLCSGILPSNYIVKR
jgi:hypothetical protein